jgi:hypothetical protein
VSAQTPYQSPRLTAARFSSKVSKMNGIEISHYKGFSAQALVYKNGSGDPRSHVRLFNVAVRIARDDDPAQATSLFKLPPGSYESLGDARRAGWAHARTLIDSLAPGATLDTLVND